MGYFSYSLILRNFIIFLLVLGATCFYDTWLCPFHSILDYSLKEHGDDSFNLLIIFWVLTPSNFSLPSSGCLTKESSKMNGTVLESFSLYVFNAHFKILLSSNHVLIFKSNYLKGPVFFLFWLLQTKYFKEEDFSDTSFFV